MRRKIVRFQKLMWGNIMRSTKSQKVSVLNYSIDIELIYATENKYLFDFVGIRCYQILYLSSYTVLNLLSISID